MVSVTPLRLCTYNDRPLDVFFEISRAPQLQHNMSFENNVALRIFTNCTEANPHIILAHADSGRSSAPRCQKQSAGGVGGQEDHHAHRDT
jgi:hypothetical protein